MESLTAAGVSSLPTRLPSNVNLKVPGTKGRGHDNSSVLRMSRLAWLFAKPFLQRKGGVSAE